MPEPLKNLYKHELVESIANEIQAIEKDFPVNRFVSEVLDNSWQQRELKERIARVTEVMSDCLNQNYVENLSLLKDLSPHFSGLAHLFIPTYVEMYGLDYLEDSIDAMAELTSGSTCEFAVRHFMLRYEERIWQQMSVWAESEDEHIRRLSSEGLRPRLPWAIGVPVLKKKPAPIIAILEKLKTDPSEYVRRSVANNLNDISKDHPDMVLQTVRKWRGISPETDRLVKHACRTLLKRGDSRAMRLFGFNAPDAMTIENLSCTPELKEGEQLNFSFELKYKSVISGKLRLEYAIDFLLANGNHSRKVFKISETSIAGTERRIEKKHNFKPITTRTYYGGRQGLAIIVNGREMASHSFMLIKP